MVEHEQGKQKYYNCGGESRSGNSVIRVSMYQYEKYSYVRHR